METPLHVILSEISSVIDVRDAEVSAPMPGWSHNIYVLKLSSGQKWSLRIAKDEFAASLANRSVATMRYIKQVLPTLQIPAVIYNAKSYALLEYMDGTSIGSWNSHKLSNQRRHKLLEGLATFLYKLWTIPALALESDVSATTYRDWLLDEVDKAICRSIRNPGWGRTINFLQRRARVDSLIPLQGGLGTAIKHGDMNALNVLMNEVGLSGVIDWDTVSFVPAPAAIQYPLFIADIPGFYNDDVPEGMEFKDDRAYLEDAIRRLSVDAGSVADLLASSRERQFFELSLCNKRINEEYVRLRLGDAEYDRTAAIEQLDEFILVNVEIGNHPEVTELRRQLSAESNEIL